MEKFNTLTSTVIPLPNEDVDTDQIIPARFFKVDNSTRIRRKLIQRLEI